MECGYQSSRKTAIPVAEAKLLFAGMVSDDEEQA